MVEPFSTAAGVVGLISFAIKLTGSLVEYYKSVKGFGEKASKTIEKLQKLFAILRELEAVLSVRKEAPNGNRLLEQQIQSSIESCRSSIEDLESEWRKVKETSPASFGDTVKKSGRRLLYPFRQSTLQNIEEIVDDMRENLDLAIGVLELKDTTQIRNDVADIKEVLEFMRIDGISSTLRAWLQAPDAYNNLNAAILKRHPGTGAWFINSSRFTKWLKDENSFLWIKGFAGTGKTILCASATEAILQHRRANPRIGVACFFFSFNDASKQDELAMLRALLLQLSGQAQEGCPALAHLHEQRNRGSPSSTSLIDCLRLFIQHFDHVHIVVDAIDESPRDGARGRVLNVIQSLQQLECGGLHLLMSSRAEPDIECILDVPPEQQITMKDSGVERDIVDHISSQLETSPTLRKWLPHRDKIETFLSQRAQGVFRWVECQLIALQSCPCSDFHLDRLLNSLPSSLDETYERMLCNIDKSLVDDARRILTLLCFATRPLAVSELIEGIAVDIVEPVGLNRRKRLKDASDIQNICPGLVNISIEASYVDYRRSDDLDRRRIPTARIAHFSVQQYLRSKQVQEQQAQCFSLEYRVSHVDIAKLCVLYFLDGEFLEVKPIRSLLEDFPFADYALQNWIHHYKETKHGDNQLEQIVLRLFQLPKDKFSSWVKWNKQRCRRRDHLVWFLFVVDDSPSPVLLSAALGLDSITYQLIEEQERNETANGTRFRSEIDTALLIASSLGHENVVRLIISQLISERSSEENYSEALEEAAQGGHVEIARLLLDHGANVNGRLNKGEPPLLLAYINHQQQTVHLLLEKGADVNASSTEMGNTLEYAVEYGDVAMIRLLLDKGAHINSGSTKFGTPLHKAVFHSYEMTCFLFERGADVNFRGGSPDSILQAAVTTCDPRMVQLMLDKEADVNARGGTHGCALHTALQCRKNMLATKSQTLVDQVVHVPPLNKRASTRWQAETQGDESMLAKIVQMLIDADANVNALDNNERTALQVAIEQCDEDIARLLLDNGADVNFHVKGTPLHSAVGINYLKKFDSLYYHDDDSNMTKFFVAFEAYEKQLLKLLLDAGAHINVQDEEGRRPLGLAIKRGDNEVAQFLRDRGAKE